MKHKERDNETTRLMEALTALITNELPWPSRDADKTHEQAKAIALTVMVPMISGFTEAVLSEQS